MRAAARLARGFTPHPGWRNFVPPGWRVLTSQQEALEVLLVLIQSQPWRSDRTASWTQILRTLVEHMDWDTGLITALTATRLGAAGDRATRTVSRVIAWAQDAGVLVVIEPGATAEFLAADRNRTPTYALISNTPRPAPPQNEDQDDEDQDDDQNPAAAEPPSSENALLTGSTTEIGDLPNFLVGITTRTKRLGHPAPATTSWPVLQVPQGPSERSAAGRRLLHELNLDPGGVSSRAAKINLSRWWAMLKPWWDTGWSPRGLAWAIEHHPDRPDHHRGDIRASATDLIAVIGARLKPWRDRHHQLPAHLVGIPSDYRTTQAASLSARINAAAATAARPTTTAPTAPSTEGQQARAHIARVLAARRSLRR